jgi:hypothetical protein
MFYRYCFLIVEDKYQGTNDVRHSKGLGKQGTGNAIERVFKNLPISPYLGVIFTVVNLLYIELVLFQTLVRNQSYGK